MPSQEASCPRITGNFTVGIAAHRSAGHDPRIIFHHVSDDSDAYDNAFMPVYAIDKYLEHHCKEHCKYLYVLSSATIRVPPLNYRGPVGRLFCAYACRLQTQR